MPSAAATKPTVTHPADIAWSLLGHDHWQTARDILDAVFRPNARVAVKSCHASSKTFTAADAVVLALLSGGDVLTTAPTWEQVKSVLWGTIRRAVDDARVDLSPWQVNQTDITTPSGARAIGLSTNEGVRFQGWHARPESFLLILFDEAPGVQADIYEAAQGISSGGDVRWLLLGNPVLASGPFYDLYAGDAPGWRRFTIDAFDTPNLAGLTLEDLLTLPEHELDVAPRPYLVTRRWVRDMFYQWGEDHPSWDARVRGRFPRMGTDALIALSWVEDANGRPHDQENTATLSAGVDVAGPGEDETVVAVRRGADVLSVTAWAQADPRHEVIEHLRSYLHAGLKTVTVDGVGMGHYFAEDVKAALASYGVTVRSANVGLPSDDLDDRGDKRYANLKAEWFWALRERFMNGEIRANGRIDQTTQSQLVSVLYQQPKGVVTIEKKEDARKRGVKSPDRAEALMLAFAPADPLAAFGASLGQGMKYTGGRAAVARPSRGRR